MRNMHIVFVTPKHIQRHVMDRTVHCKSKKTAPFYFCNNFVKPSSIFGNFWHTCTPI